MLFNSYVFLLIFLPTVIIGTVLISRFGVRALLLWVLLSSLVFYGYWRPTLVLLLIGSISVNVLIGYLLRLAQPCRPKGRALLVLGVGFNLALLGYYKYAGFLVANAAVLVGAEWKLPDIVLPIGISFFTFQQIAYLVDAHRNRLEKIDVLKYAVFVAFFPQLITGPIVHHKQIVPQLTADNLKKLTGLNFAVGISIFAIGLFKKVVLADGAGVVADRAFDAAASGVTLSTIDAWLGTLGFTFQLYFDFSGYSDMAIGLARLFGIVLPLNFYSPYKALSIVDFWRRWHITLSTFLKDYLYVPLGGNRKGPLRRYGNLLAAMLLGGLWHGAAWTFVLWGGLHGLLLILNHGWRALKERRQQGDGSYNPASKAASWLLTFLCVAFSWVMFRAANLDTALMMWQSMFGLGEHPILSISWVQGGLREYVLGAIHLGICAAVAFFAPNVFELFSRYNCALTDDYFADAPNRRHLEWHPSSKFACCVAMLFTLSVLGLSAETPFLYFQF